MFSIGLAALRTLLVGATKARSRKKEVNLYIKVGTGQTALDDFHSVNPSNVKQYTNTFRFGLNRPLVRNLISSCPSEFNQSL